MTRVASSSRKRTPLRTSQTAAAAGGKKSRSPKYQGDSDTEQVALPRAAHRTAVDRRGCGAVEARWWCDGRRKHAG